MSKQTTIGLMLTGGGARGAYQAGVLKALAEVMAEEPGLLAQVKVISGLSAGSLNAAYCAAGIDDLVSCTRQLNQLWCSLTPEQVYRTDFLSFSKISLSWISDLSVGALYRQKKGKGLLETDPLRKLIEQNIDFKRIRQHIESGRLHALCVSAFNYNKNALMNFVTGSDEIRPWQSGRRKGVTQELTVDHIMASCAIPLLFPAVKVGEYYYGDGTVRNTAPISPMVRLGCDKVLIVGVRPRTEILGDEYQVGYPTTARIFGLVLNSLFFDSLDSDVERLKHINTLAKNSSSPIAKMRKVESLWLRPSVDIAEIARRSRGGLPRSVRYLLGGLGGRQESSEIASYLLFESRYTEALCEQGYRDCLEQKTSILDFLSQ